MWLTTFLICALVYTCVRTQEEVQVDIAQGKLKGQKLNTAYRGKPYYSFKGIPYAKPNVGSNKFRTSQPAEPWEGVYDATMHRQTCPFFCMIRKDFVGDEDCLYLNIYSPTMDQNARKAVIVFIHTGGFQAGSGDEDVFGPDFLVEEDVILVTINYRLGAIGFLNTGDVNAPGNEGLKDQVMALRWVRDNIHAFGGCQNRVTIFGQSAGAAAVQFLMMSPMSEGLFKGAIQMSGTALNTWASTYKAQEASFKLGKILGIDTTDSAELVSKLKEFSAKEIVGATGELAKSENFLSGDMFTFVPSVEPKVGQEIFLPNDVFDLAENGKITDVPLMVGITADESAFFVDMVFEGALAMKDQFEIFVPSLLNATDSAYKKHIGDMLKKFYFGDKELSADTRKEFKTMLDDVLFNQGTYLSEKILSARNSAPIYEFLFSYVSPFGILKNLFHFEEGAAHGDEIGYVFYSHAFKNLPESGSTREKIQRVMTKLFTNFAKDDNPTSKLDEYLTVNWEPRGKEGKYLNINEELKMETGMFSDRAKFWYDLFKDVLGKYA